MSFLSFATEWLMDIIDPAVVIVNGRRVAWGALTGSCESLPIIEWQRVLRNSARRVSFEVKNVLECVTYPILFDCSHQTNNSISKRARRVHGIPFSKSGWAEQATGNRAVHEKKGKRWFGCWNEELSKEVFNKIINCTFFYFVLLPSLLSLKW